jgi:hypothetical protein
MPFVLRPPIRKIGLSFALVVAAFAFTASPALAASCPTEPSTQIFSIYGDLDFYSLVDGGDFDSTTPGWTFNRARPESTDALKRINAPHLGSDKDAKSLKIDKQGTAISAPVCVSILHPSFRFFAFKRDGGYGDLNVTLRYRTSGGDTDRDVPVGSLYSDSFRSWKLAQSLPLWDALPLGRNEIAQVRLVFDYGFKANGAPDPNVRNLWRIDEVYVDPYRR